MFPKGVHSKKYWGDRLVWVMGENLKNHGSILVQFDVSTFLSYFRGLTIASADCSIKDRAEDGELLAEPNKTLWSGKVPPCRWQPSDLVTL